MNSGIYEIVNTVNGHRYIGSAVNIHGRWSHHKNRLIKNKHHSQYLQRAWNKYGADCFKFRVIEYCFFFVLIPREQYYIDILCPEYNMAPVAGSSLGIKRAPFTAEHKAKLSAANIGRKLSPESKAKMSASHTGKKMPPFTDKHKANISAWQIARREKRLQQQEAA